MRAMPANAIDAIVCDPPYGLSNTSPKLVAETISRWVSGDREYVPAGKGFNSERWDAFVPPVAIWDEALRVLKPGGLLVAFAGARTYDLMGMGIRLAGFEIRDTLAYLYGTGFPHSMNVAQSLRNAGHTDEADAWDGWGTALKPAIEPIVLARKPLDGTLMHNVLTHSVGAYNIDATRIATTDALGGGAETATRSEAKGGWARPWMDDEQAVAAHAARVRANVAKAEALGRFPANVVITHADTCTPAGIKQVKSNSHHPASRGAGGLATDGHSGQSGLIERRPTLETVEAWDCVPGCPVRELDEQSATAKPASARAKAADTGGASRFFYTAKPSKHERVEVNGVKHPTVKPLSLMAWLIRLCVPPGGVVLDPFAGSGTTGEAALQVGVASILIEREAKYVPLIRARIDRATRADGASLAPPAPLRVEDTGEGDVLTLFDLGVAS